MKRKTLHIISFIPLAQCFCWFLYYFFLIKSTYSYKGKECMISTLTVFFGGLPIWILMQVLQNVIDQTSLMHSIAGYLCMYLFMLVTGQIMVWRMKKWHTEES